MKLPFHAIVPGEQLSRMCPASRLAAEGVLVQGSTLIGARIAFVVMVVDGRLAGTIREHALWEGQLSPSLMRVGAGSEYVPEEKGTFYSVQDRRFMGGEMSACAWPEPEAPRCLTSFGSAVQWCEEQAVGLVRDRIKTRDHVLCSMSIHRHDTVEDRIQSRLAGRLAMKEGPDYVIHWVQAEIATLAWAGRDDRTLALLPHTEREIEQAVEPLYQAA